MEDKSFKLTIVMEINLTDDEQHMFETKDKEDNPSPPSTPMTPNSNCTDYTPPHQSTDRRKTAFLQNKISAVTGLYRIDPDPNPCDLPLSLAHDKINIYLDDD
eukprot:7590845-Ditylum_brightwellii.AAC.1